jgi:hypothetical protein
LRGTPPSFRVAFLVRGKPAWTTALASLCAGERDALKILLGVFAAGRSSLRSSTSVA